MAVVRRRTREDQREPSPIVSPPVAVAPAKQPTGPATDAAAAWVQAPAEVPAEAAHEQGAPAGHHVGNVPVDAPGRLTIQRDGPFQLSTPSLLSPPDPASRYKLGGDQQLQLDADLMERFRGHLRLQFDPAAVKSAMRRVNLNLPPATSAPAAGPQPLTGPLPAPPTPVVPAGAGPAETKAADASDILGAITAIPAVDTALNDLQAKALQTAERDWGRLTGGEKGIFVTSLAIIGGGAIAGLSTDPDARSLAISQLNGKVLPVPGVDWLHLEVNTEKDNVMVGIHADVGALLPKEWGFGKGSPSAIGGPPSAIQRDVDGEASAELGVLDADALLSQLQRPTGGAPLPASLSAELGDAYGFDFSSVRVHADDAADRIAASVGARALTTGSAMYVRPAFLDSDGAEGRKLLAHEAYHVVQQSRGPVTGTPITDQLAVSDPSDRHEAEARAAAEAFERRSRPVSGDSGAE